MKKYVIPILCAVTILIATIFSTSISNYLEKKIIRDQYILIPGVNGYAKEEGFMYVDVTKEYVPYSYQDLINIIYSAINNGWTNFTFYCPNEYETCIKDMEKISNDNLILTHINNYVHPYNSFTNIATTIYESGEIDLEIYHVYTQEQIEKIDEEINKIIKENTSEKNTDYENIKALHDYIVNNTKYDQTVDSNGNSKYKSNIAWGLLFEHYATCNGYTDTMAIMLTKLGYKNYKIATTPDQISYQSTGHVWNAVYIDLKDGKGPRWLHIDLTWDDPVSKSGKDYLYHKYFLVDNEAIKKVDEEGETKLEEHNFDPSVYLEFNESINEIISKKVES